VSRLDLLDPREVAGLGGIEVVARGVVEGFLAGLHHSPYRGFSVEFAEHRPYQPGDELRYLDWKILGRRDRLYVKQYEEETNLRATIVLDVSRSMAWAGSPERSLSKFDYATRLAAALALILLRARSSRRGCGPASGFSWFASSWPWIPGAARPPKRRCAGSRTCCDAGGWCCSSPICW
jgi:uncharacterized protein (DUF58 family)